MNVPKWEITAIDKVRKGFVWRVRKEVNGGSCHVPMLHGIRSQDL
jgi:hypothetical protein